MTDATAYISAATAADHRRKKNALDKAKANYLCSQLRLRLQYAKLKVDYGWQRQTLNEVENLYFRHSQRRRHAAASTSTLFSAASSSSILPASSSGNTGIEAMTDHNTEAIPTNGVTHDPQSTSEGDRPEHETTTASSPTKTTPTNANGSNPASNSTSPQKQHTPPMASLTSTGPIHSSPSYTSFEPAYQPPHPYAHYPPHVVAGHIPPPPPPGTPPYTDYSPHQYLSKAYVANSLFPVNGPPPGSGSGSGSQLTYDSFWSSHTSWGMQSPTPNGAPPPGALPNGMAVAGSPTPAPPPVAVSGLQNS